MPNLNMGNGAPLRDSANYATIFRERRFFLRTQLGKSVRDFVPANKSCAKTDGSCNVKVPSFEAASHVNSCATFQQMEVKSVEKK